MAVAQRLHFRCALRLGLTALCVIAAGCGGDDTSADTEQIASVLKRFATSESVDVQCDGAVSRRYVREVYRTLENCRESNTNNAAPPRATVAETRIKGDAATAALTLEGGDEDATTGRVALARIGGERLSGLDRAVRIAVRRCA